MMTLSEYPDYDQKIRRRCLQIGRLRSCGMFLCRAVGRCSFVSYVVEQESQIIPAHQQESASKQCENNPLQFENSKWTDCAEGAILNIFSDKNN